MHQDGLLLIHLRSLVFESKSFLDSISNLRSLVLFQSRQEGSLKSITKETDAYLTRVAMF